MEYQTTVSATKPIAITIGNFDGLHRGHQRLLSELRTIATALHCTPVLITFSPHTLLVVRPDIDLRYLTTLEEKLALAKSCASIFDSIVIHFTPQVASMNADAFMDSLRANFMLKAIVVGTNFSLGHQRMGDVAFLKHYGQQHDILVQAIPLEESDSTRISSTHIRTFVSEGQVREATALLGHPFTITDIVRHGDKRGRQLGFPTANLIPEAHKLLPANGVYAVHVHLDEEASRDASNASLVYNAVANVGVRPTFDGKVHIVEAHLLDIQPDIYDQRITIDFIARLRNEQRFSGIEALKAQISADVQQTRQMLL